MSVKVKHTQAILRADIVGLPADHLRAMLDSVLAEDAPPRPGEMSSGLLAVAEAATAGLKPDLHCDSRLSDDLHEGSDDLLPELRILQAVLAGTGPVPGATDNLVPTAPLQWNRPAPPPAQMRRRGRFPPPPAFRPPPIQVQAPAPAPDIAPLPMPAPVTLPTNFAAEAEAALLLAEIGRPVLGPAAGWAGDEPLDTVDTFPIPEDTGYQIPTIDADLAIAAPDIADFIPQEVEPIGADMDLLLSHHGNSPAIEPEEFPLPEEPDHAAGLGRDLDLLFTAPPVARAKPRKLHQGHRPAPTPSTMAVPAPAPTVTVAPIPIATPDDAAFKPVAPTISLAATIPAAHKAKAPKSEQTAAPALSASPTADQSIAPPTGAPDKPVAPTISLAAAKPRTRKAKPAKPEQTGAASSIALAPLAPAPPAPALSASPAADQSIAPPTGAPDKPVAPTISLAAAKPRTRKAKPAKPERREAAPVALAAAPSPVPPAIEPAPDPAPAPAEPPTPAKSPLSVKLKSRKAPTEPDKPADEPASPDHGAQPPPPARPAEPETYPAPPPQPMPTPAPVSEPEPEPEPELGEPLAGLGALADEFIAAYRKSGGPAPASFGDPTLPPNSQALEELLSDPPPATDFGALDLLTAAWGKSLQNCASRSLLAAAYNLSRNFGLPGKLPMSASRAWRMLDAHVFQWDMANQLRIIGQFIADWQKTQKTFLILDHGEIEMIENLFEALDPAENMDLMAGVMNFKVLSNRRMGLIRRIPTRLKKQIQPMLPAGHQDALTILAHHKALLERLADPNGFAPIVETAGKMLDEMDKLMKLAAAASAPQIPPPAGGGQALGRIG